MFLNFIEVYKYLMKRSFDICGYDYKSLVYFENIIKKLKIPKKENCTISSNYCVTLKGYVIFIEKRCIAYDLINPLNHPNVIIRDCNI